MSAQTKEQKLKALTPGNLLVEFDLDATNGDGSLFSTASYSWNLSQTQFVDLQKLMVNTTQAELIALGEKYAAANEAAKSAPVAVA